MKPMYRFFFHDKSFCFRQTGQILIYSTHNKTSGVGRPVSEGGWGQRRPSRINVKFMSGLESKFELREAVVDLIVVFTFHREL